MAKKRERTESQRQAEARYKDKNYDRLAIMIPKGERERYHKIASDHGLSLKRMIVAAVNEYEQNHQNP